jgi:hypothetical protein
MKTSFAKFALIASLNLLVSAAFAGGDGTDEIGNPKSGSNAPAAGTPIAGAPAGVNVVAEIVVTGTRVQNAVVLTSATALPNGLFQVSVSLPNGNIFLARVGDDVANFVSQGWVPSEVSAEAQQDLMSIAESAQQQDSSVQAIFGTREAGSTRGGTMGYTSFQ